MTLPFPFPVVSYAEGRVRLLDQTLLPGSVRFRDCRTIAAVCRAIKELAVRGAPAIGIAAAYGLVLSWHTGVAAGEDLPALRARLRRDHDRLAATRPTAVNLFWALRRALAVAERHLAAGDDPAVVLGALHTAARAIHDEDIAMGRAMGEAGAALLPDVCTVLTHCNAGGLATGGYGTALGVIYAAVAAGKRVRVFADETRPLLQGARLTAFELQSRGVDVTVIPDSAAATVLRQGKIDAVITGADRIAANGDAANKIGTYPLAVLAHRHGVPFYVAAPASTFDPATETGETIVIEERDPAEVHIIGGVRVTPEGVAAYNPAFDVVPHDLVMAIITEHGVFRPPYADSLRPVLAAAARY
ncbi:MAG: S-methyl-5-thioribose-1-phosphate isomerase [Verrucomicrobiota bacterium]